MSKASPVYNDQLDAAQESNNLLASNAAASNSNSSNAPYPHAYVQAGNVPIPIALPVAEPSAYPSSYPTIASAPPSAPLLSGPNLVGDGRRVTVEEQIVVEREQEDTGCDALSKLHMRRVHLCPSCGKETEGSVDKGRLALLGCVCCCFKGCCFPLLLLFCFRREQRSICGMVEQTSLGSCLAPDPDNAEDKSTCAPCSMQTRVTVTVGSAPAAPTMAMGQQDQRL